MWTVSKILSSVWTTTRSRQQAARPAALPEDQSMAVGDRGKSPNVTGTRPRKRADAPADRPGRKSVKSAAGRGAGQPKHAAQRSRGFKTGETRKAGPKKTRRGTTTRSADK